MVMTPKVRDLFKEKFEEVGISCEGLRVGDFVDVGLECKIPLTWLFSDLGKDDVHRVHQAEDIYFNVINTLDVKDEYSAVFDWICITDDISFAEAKVEEDF